MPETQTEINIREITESNLRARVEVLSAQHEFPILDFSAGTDDYSLPNTGLRRRNEILVGCDFLDRTKQRRTSLEYRRLKIPDLDGNWRESLYGKINCHFFEDKSGEVKIIKKRLIEAGIWNLSHRIVATISPISMESIELFLSTYFLAQKEAFEFIREQNEFYERYGI